MRKKRTAPIVAFLLIFLSADAQTYVSGGIFTSTVWTLAGSPYIITDDVVVFDDLVLTIEPGVVIQVHPDKRIELRNSRLVAIGTEAQSILFTCTDASSTWQGIVPLGLVTVYSGNQMHLEYCTIEKASIGVDFDDAYHTPYEFLHCEFRDCTAGVQDADIDFHYGYYLFQDCYFHDNVTGINQGLQTVIGSRFENNGTGARTYHLEGCTLTGNSVLAASAPRMIGCIVRENNIGYDGGLANGWIIDNNVVVGNNIGFRMAAFFTDDGSFANNVICRNSLYNIQRVSWGSNQAAHIPGTCFCTDDEATAAASIYDAVDDLSVGLIDYLPLVTDPWCINFTVGVNEMEPSGFSISPNPTQGAVLVSGHDLGRVLVLDASGRLLIDQSFNTRPNYQIDVAQFPPGVYLLRVLQGHSWSNAHLVKER